MSLTRQSMIRRFLSTHGESNALDRTRAFVTRSISGLDEIGSRQTAGDVSGDSGTSLIAERWQDGNAGIDVSEVGKFSAMAAEWWDPRGPMGPLHSMNPIRVKFIRQVMCEHFRRDVYSSRPFDGLKIADIGSGGGLLSEPLARLGGRVTGVDASEEASKVATLHAQADPGISGSIRYRVGTAERLADEGAEFDAVIASEVIEHVPDPEPFCTALARITAPGGCLIISTLNRTPRAYAMAILAAERVLGVVPRGTHEWSKFISPDELAMMMQSYGMRLERIRGMSLSLAGGGWALTSDLGVNYIAAFTREPAGAV